MPLLYSVCPVSIHIICLIIYLNEFNIELNCFLFFKEKLNKLYFIFTYLKYIIYFIYLN